MTALHPLRHCQNVARWTPFPSLHPIGTLNGVSPSCVSGWREMPRISHWPPLCRKQSYLRCGIDYSRKALHDKTRFPLWNVPTASRLSDRTFSMRFLSVCVSAFRSRQEEDNVKRDWTSMLEIIDSSQGVSTDGCDNSSNMAASHELECTDIEDITSPGQIDIDILQESETPEIISSFANLPLMPETYTLASYVDHSETLQKLVQMGVDLSKIECRKGVPDMLMKMDFEKDIKDKLVFLHHFGIPGDRLGAFITKNPFILGEELQNLEARVHYLLEKNFSETAISQVINRAPFFLNFSIERLDNKLGYYQHLFQFNDSEIRRVITRCPKLVTMTIARPKENLFVLEFQCGFSKTALRSMVLQEPAILLRGKYKLIATFDYLHNTMKLPHKLLMKTPQVFHGRIESIKDRHRYLLTLRRNQYSPLEPGYVPLMALFKLPDDVFSEEIAKTKPDEYDRFLKSCRI